MAGKLSIIMPRSVSFVFMQNWHWIFYSLHFTCHVFNLLFWQI